MKDCFFFILAAILSVNISCHCYAGVNTDADDSVAALFNVLLESYNENWISNYDVLDGFAITSGLPESGDNLFGFERSVKGVAPKDTLVTIFICLYDATAGELYAASEIVLEPVGAIGFFDKTIQLFNGDNYVIVTAERAGARALASSVIKCKEAGIKTMLENGIALPGQWSVGSE